MITVNHLNDMVPNINNNVLVTDSYGSFRVVELNDIKEAGLDADEYGYHDFVWFNSMIEEYYSLDDYPYWTELTFDYKTLATSVNIPKKDKPSFSIPGYKIVGGTVVKI